MLQNAKKFQVSQVLEKHQPKQWPSYKKRSRAGLRCSMSNGYRFLLQMKRFAKAPDFSLFRNYGIVWRRP